jgi:hypothetical protein
MNTLEKLHSNFMENKSLQLLELSLFDLFWSTKNVRDRGNPPTYHHKLRDRGNPPTYHHKLRDRGNPQTYHHKLDRGNPPTYHHNL